MGLLCLAMLIVAILVAVPWLANDHVASDMAQIPERIGLQGFYPAERNDAGPFRWAMPTSTASVRITTPGTYRVALRLQEGAAGQPPRTVRVAVNGRPVGETQLSPRPQDFIATYTLTPEEWARSPWIEVGLEATPLTISGDRRVLGPVVTAFRLEQVVGPTVWQPRLLIFCLLVLVGGYLLLRVGGLAIRWSVGTLGLLTLALVAYAALDRPAILRLLYVSSSDGGILWAVALGIVAVACLLFVARRDVPGLRLAETRDALFLGVLMVISCAPYVAHLGFYGDDWLFLKYLTIARENTFLGLWRSLWEHEPVVRQRPVQITFMAAVFRFFGSEPLPYHIANVAVLTTMVVCLYLALRMLELPRLPALSITLLYALLPQYSTDRFWVVASSMAVQSQAAFFLAVLAGFLAVRQRRSRRAFAWSALTLVALAVSLLAYEVVLPLFVLSAAATWWLGRRVGRAHRWLALFTAAQAAVVVATIVFKSRVTVRLSVNDLGAQLPFIVRQLFNWHYGPGDYGLNIRKATEIGYGDLGVALPVTAAGLSDRYTDSAVIILALAFAMMIVAYLGHLGRAPGAEWFSAARWASLAAAGVVVFWSGYAVFLTTTQVQFAVAGIGNRTTIGATVGIAITMVGILGLVCARLPARWRARSFTGVVAVLCCCGVITFSTYGAFWGQASRQQMAILAAVRAQYPAFPAGDTLILDGACAYVGPAQVFESAWDFASALTVVNGYPAVLADIVTPRLTAEPPYLLTVLYGSFRNRYPYGERLHIYNYKRDTTAILGDYAAATAYFARVNPDRSSGCPPGREGYGVHSCPGAIRDEC
ncbi:MAG: hypothetical protein U0841_23880 [Chloroflexia bacterium]